MTLSIRSRNLPKGWTGSFYIATMEAVGGVPPYTWSAVLPLGLIMDPLSGTISGTPTSPQMGSVMIRVSDSAYPKAAVATAYLLLDIEKQTVAITTASLSTGRVWQRYGATLSAQGGSPPYIWTIQGQLPDGMALQGAALNGVPRGAGTFPLRVQVADQQGNLCVRMMSLSIGEASGWTDVCTNPAMTGALQLGLVGSTFVLTSADPNAQTAAHTLTSANGLDWTPLSGSDLGIKMFNPVMVSEGDRLWLLGGDAYGQGPIVHSFSPSSGSWTQTSQAWPTGLCSSSFAATWFNGALWVMGGNRYAPIPAGQYETNDVWSSTDGVTWVQHPTPPWMPRVMACATVFGGRMWVGGGGLCDKYRPISWLGDLWSTADGVAWRHESIGAWSGVAMVAMQGTANRLYVLTVDGDKSTGPAPISSWVMAGGGWTPSSQPIGLSRGTSMSVGTAAIGDTLLVASGQDCKLRAN